MDAALDWVLALVSSVDPVARTILAGLGILLETSILVGLIVPGDSIVLIASTAVEGPVQYFSLIVAVILGALIGESIGFVLGRLFGPVIRRSWVGRRIGEKNWRRAEIYLGHRGGIAVFVSRFLPVLHSIVPLTVGMSAMPYRRFMAWTIPACVIWASAYVSVGSLAAGGYRELQDQLDGAAYLFVGAIGTVLIVAYVAKRIIGLREEKYMREEKYIADESDSGR